MNKTRQPPTSLALFVLTRNNAIAAVFSYALTVSLANALGPEHFGRYSLALIVGSILSILIAFGTDQTAPASFARSASPRVPLARILWLRMGIAALCLIAVGLYAITDAALSFLLCCLIPANLNLAFLYETAGRNERYSSIYLAERLAYVSAVFTLIFLDAVALPLVFSSILMATVLSLAFQARDTWSSLRVIAWVRPTQLLPLLRTNLPLVVVSLAVFSYGGFSRVVLEQSLGQESLGIYSAGWQLITIGTLFQSQITRVWRLRISVAVSQRDRATLTSLLRTYLALGTAPLALISGVMFLVPELIVSALFAPSYSPLVGVVPVLGLYLVVINLAGLAEILWVAIGRNTLFMLVNVVAGLVLLAVLMYLGPDAGLRGFASATVATHFVATAVLIGLWYSVFRSEVS